MLHPVTAITALTLAAATFTTNLHAAVVADSLPFPGTPDWSDVVFPGTSMTTDGTTSVLSTAQNAGVWFGYLGSQNPPAWQPGSSTDGNYLSVEASFSSNMADFSAYLYDLSWLANISFAPTGCNGNIGSCYGQVGAAGVGVGHAGATMNDYVETFIPLDLTVPHTYEFLMKDGMVSYRIDGTVVYSGQAYASPFSSPVLVIGDGSATTLTGQGSMTVYGVSFDNAPVADVLLTTVPVPAAVWLFASGLLGLVSVARRN